MKIRLLANSLLLAFPLAVAVSLISLKQANNLSFAVTNQSYEKNQWQMCQPNLLYVETRLQYRFTRPTWWPPKETPWKTTLSLISAKVLDSKGRTIPVDKTYDTPIFPGKPPGQQQTYWMGHTFILRPRGSYDLSKGGILTLRMKAQAQDTPNGSPLWQGETSYPLSPTTMQPSIKTTAIIRNAVPK